MTQTKTTERRLTLGRILRWTWPKSEHLRGVARVMGFFAVVFAVIGALAARSAYGDVEKQALLVGRQLAGFEDLVGGSHRLVLNGEPVYIASAVIDQPVNEVLDRFELACKKSHIGLADEFKRLPTDTRERLADDLGVDAADGSSLGILRDETKFEGMVACLVPDPNRGESSVFARLQAFGRSGDLADVGLLRYAYARRTDTGRTQVITSWTDGSFRLSSFTLPASGELPGSDSAHAPRPERAKRLLSAQIDGAPHAVRIYDAQTTPAQVFAQYDRDLPARGWTITPFVTQEAPNVRAYSHHDVELMVVVDPSDHGTMVSLVETRLGP